LAVAVLELLSVAIQFFQLLHLLAVVVVEMLDHLVVVLNEVVMVDQAEPMAAVVVLAVVVLVQQVKVKMAQRM
jgi:hypothetical protein